MVRVVGVRFKTAGKVYYFDPADFEITAGGKVVVETARGVEFGEVAVGPKEVPEEQVVQPLKKVLRLGTDRDEIAFAENKRKEQEAFSSAQKRIESHALDMNLVDVEYTFDGSKVIFYFTAEGRIDFRELVRDLAGVFRTRIEMRQIGVRDEAKLLGGIGPCGRILCCTSFLGDFAPVSIRMAKDQNLSLNPSKISGLCGRLMCCLRYEQETYDAAKKDPTLAPGYVPPAVPAEETVPLDDLEDRPAPRIVARPDREAGFGARIAQAPVPAAERPLRREERPSPVERERRSPLVDRPAGADRPAPSDRPQGRERPAPVQTPVAGRPQGQPKGPRERPAQGQAQAQQPGQDRRGAQRQGRQRPQGAEAQHQGQQVQQGQPGQQQGQGRQRQQQQPRQPQGQPGQGQQPQQGPKGGQPGAQGQRPGRGQRQGDRAAVERPERPQPERNAASPERLPGERLSGERFQGQQQTDKPEGGSGQSRNRNHRHRRRGGGGPKPGGTGPTEGGGQE